ncbi:NADPH-dependent FMN reductase [Kutzneria viridogrisea]|uniref:NADPH-dependent FMN reductase-like domain-containing protein n=2 Tax=Kutzneria TaxID=43356 RepID=W5W1X5_9PSEU|nr:NADPH-dependent FMN reductase [Kutzneria albida]AHH94795.1 hypothetical protein KALB_1422 [Kutzneria albida DSM 43870]MBA8930464.1 FMN reductase [Kutzneria viridogrisea]
MSSVLVLSGSPSRSSKTARVGDHIVDRLGVGGVRASHVRLRELPAEALLAADTAHPGIAEVTEALAEADGVVLATPTYKAAYSGLLKVFLDLLPQFGLAGKTVLPIATGGTIAHVLALDYGLRPVLQSLAPRHVIQSYFLLDQHLEVAPTGVLAIKPETERTLAEIVDEFRHALITSRPFQRTA